MRVTRAGTAESAGRRSRSGSQATRRQSGAGEVEMATPGGSVVQTPVAATPSQGLASPSPGLGGRAPGTGSQARGRRRSHGHGQPSGGGSSSQVLPTPVAPNRAWRGDMGQFQAQAFAQRRLPSMPPSPSADPSQVREQFL